MTNEQLITQLESLKDELFDEESSLLGTYGDRVPSSDPIGNKTRKIARLRIYITALENVLAQLKLVKSFNLSDKFNNAVEPRTAKGSLD